MPEPEELREVVVDEDLKPAVTVDLNKPAETKPPEQKSGETDSQYLNRIKQFENQMNASRRVTEGLKRDMEEIKRLVSQRNAPEPQPVATQDELDRMVEAGQWKQAVEKLAEKKAMEIMEKQNSQRTMTESLARRNEILEKSKKAVLERYPELDPEAGDPESEVAKAYVQVWNENPDLWQNERGVLVAMTLMEQRLKSSKPSVPEDSSRRVRASAVSTPPSRTGVKSGIIQLTKEQKQFCDENRIPYDRYARSLQGIETNGSVES